MAVLAGFPSNSAGEGSIPQSSQGSLVHPGAMRVRVRVRIEVN